MGELLKMVHAKYSYWQALLDSHCFQKFCSDRHVVSQQCVGQPHFGEGGPNAPFWGPTPSISSPSLSAEKWLSSPASRSVKHIESP